MATARFTLFPDLNFFLPHERRSGQFEESFEYGQSVKHLIEAAGVPHTEVGQIQANGRPVDFNYLVQDGDAIDVQRATASNAPLTFPPRFVLDNHLGRLAAYLRMLGFDTLYRNNLDDDDLAAISAAEDRVLLTRDRRLLMRKIVRLGYCLRSLDSFEQLVEVLRRYNLFNQTAPFKRCLSCNGLLQPVDKAIILDRLLPLTKKYFNEFHTCPTCGQIYWKGSHYEHMQAMIDRLRAEENAGQDPTE